MIQKLLTLMIIAFRGIIILAQWCLFPQLIWVADMTGTSQIKRYLRLINSKLQLWTEAHTIYSWNHGVRYSTSYASLTHIKPCGSNRLGDENRHFTCTSLEKFAWRKTWKSTILSMEIFTSRVTQIAQATYQYVSAHACLTMIKKAHSRRNQKSKTEMSLTPPPPQQKSLPF